MPFDSIGYPDLQEIVLPGIGEAYVDEIVTVGDHRFVVGRIVEGNGSAFVVPVPPDVQFTPDNIAGLSIEKNNVIVSAGEAFPGHFFDGVQKLLDVGVTADGLQVVTGFIEIDPNFAGSMKTYLNKGLGADDAIKYSVLDSLGIDSGMQRISLVQDTLDFDAFLKKLPFSNVEDAQKAGAIKSAVEKLSKEIDGSFGVWEKVGKTAAKLGKGAKFVAIGVPVVGGILATANTPAMAATAQDAVEGERLSPESAAAYAGVVAGYVGSELWDPTQVGGSIVVDEAFAKLCAANPDLTPDDIAGMRPETLTSMITHSNGNTAAQQLFDSYAAMLPSDDFGDLPDNMGALIELHEAYIDAENAFEEVNGVTFMPDTQAIFASEQKMHEAGNTYWQAFAALDVDTLNQHITYMVEAAGIDVEIRQQLFDLKQSDAVVDMFEKTGNTIGLAAIALMSNSAQFFVEYAPVIADMQQGVDPVAPEPAELMQTAQLNQNIGTAPPPSMG